MTNQERRNKAIRDEFIRAKEQGKRSSFIMPELADKYFLQTSTVESIIWYRGQYSKQK